MKLKKKLKDLSSIPTELHALYDEQDGEFVLIFDIEGDGAPASGDAAKLKEMRANNIAMRKQIEELTSKLNEYDPDAYAAGLRALNHVRTEEEKKLLGEGKLDEVLAKRIEPMKADYDRQLKAAIAARDAEVERSKSMRSTLRDLKVEQALIQAAATKKLNIRPSALPDFLARGRQVFDLDEQGNNLVAMRNGEPIYDTDGTSLLTPGAFVTQLLEQAEHLFEGGHGGGSQGGSRAGSPRGRVIAASDGNAFARNLEEIATGKVNVDMKA